MAIGTPVFVSGTNVAAPTTTVTTPSFTPDANSIIFAWASARNASATPSDHTISDSLGLTWTKIGAVAGPLSNAFMKGTLFAATSTNTSMTVTVDSVGATTVATGIVTVPVGAPLDFSNFATGSVNGINPCTAALSGSPAAVIGFFATQTSTSVTQNSGLTEIVDATPTGVTSQLRFCCAYDLTSPNATLSMTANNNNVLIGLALVESGGGGGQTITGALFSNTNGFEAATVSAGYPITGGLFTNANSFFGATVIGDQTVTGSLFSNANSFQTAVVSGTYNITGSLFSNSNTFYSATVALTGANQNITGSLFTNSNSFFTSATTTSYGIAADLFSNDNTFFTGTVSTTYGVTGSLFTNPNSLFSAAISASNPINGSLFTNANTLYSASLSTAQVILADLFQNQNTVFTATVRLTDDVVFVTGFQMTMQMGDENVFAWEKINPGTKNWTPVSSGGVEPWTPVSHGTTTWTKT